MKPVSLLAILLGCGEPSGGEPENPLNHDRPLHAPLIEVGNPWAACLPTDNVLRFACTVGVVPAGPVELTVRRQDGTGPVRTWISEADRSGHAFDVWFLTSLTTYVWSARALADPRLPPVGGTFATGDPPPGAHASFGIDAGFPTSPQIGMASPCGEGAYAVIVDPQRDEVLWYENFARSELGFLDAVSFTEDRTVLAIADGALIEVDPMGRRLLELLPDVDLPHRIHHDAFRKDGLTWVLFEEPVYVDASVFLMDGFYVVDGAGTIVGEWHLADHWLPEAPVPEGQPNPFAIDVSHANGIWVDDDHQVLISLRHLSAVVSVAGDPNAPDFGEIAWRLGDPVSDFGSDYRVTSSVGPPADFERQHNAHFLPDGTLLMLDNRKSYLEPSRVLTLALDPEHARADIVREFRIGRHCDFQGSAMLTPAGNVLATCAPSRDGYEFDRETGLVRWHGNATCTRGFGSYVPRFVPVDW